MANPNNGPQRRPRGVPIPGIPNRRGRRGMGRKLGRQLIKLLMIKLSPVWLVIAILLLAISMMFLLMVGGSVLVNQEQQQAASAESLDECLDPASSNSPSAGGGAPSVQQGEVAQVGDPVDMEKMILTSDYGMRTLNGAPQFHDGIDFGTANGQSFGLPIFAVADGKVTRSQADPAGYGWWITIAHEVDGKKFESLYGHMYQNQVKVQIGDTVRAGQHIADIGDNGIGSAHLHFGIYEPAWSQGGGVNPKPWLENMRQHHQDRDPNAIGDQTSEAGTSNPDDAPEDNQPEGGDEQEQAPSTESTREGSLNRTQQANVGMIISAAKRNRDLDDEDKQRDAAKIAVALAGLQSNYISLNDEDDPNKVGVFGLAPFAGTTRDDLRDPKKASEAFYKKLIDTYDGDDRWREMDPGHVVAEMYPNMASVKDEVKNWESQAEGAINELWDDDIADENARADDELLEDQEADPCSSERVERGGELRPGTVPDEFVEWINRGAEECEAITPAILAAQISQESGFQQHGHNYANAAGYTQFIDSTWAVYGYRVDEDGNKIGNPGEGDRNSIPDAVMAQARLNCDNYNMIKGWMDEGRVQGDITLLMLSAYHAGAGAILNAGGLPQTSDGGITSDVYAKEIMENSLKFGDPEGNLNDSDSGEDEDSSDEDRSGNDRGADPAEAAAQTANIERRPFKAKLSENEARKRIKDLDNHFVGTWRREAIIAAASQIGTPYAWGGGDHFGPTQGMGPGVGVGFDCSGLMQYAIAKASERQDYLIPNRSSGDMYSNPAMKHKPLSEIKPGDFLFWGPGGSQHVAIYAGKDKNTGKDMMIEAPQQGMDVMIAPVRPGALAAELNVKDVT